MPIKALGPQSGGHSGFDYYVRSVTTSVLALGIVAATLYSILVQPRANELLIGWTGIVVGVYFGAHFSQNGGDVKSQPVQADVTVHPERRDQSPV